MKRQAIKASRQERRERRELGPGRAAQRAQHPERDVAQLPVVGDEDQKPDAGIGERGDRKPAEQEDRDRGPALARSRCDRGRSVVTSEPTKAAIGSS